MFLKMRKICDKKKKKKKIETNDVHTKFCVRID